VAVVASPADVSLGGEGVAEERFQSLVVGLGRTGDAGADGFGFVGGPTTGYQGMNLAKAGIARRLERAVQ
jgi:predicted methyltransferase